MESKKSVFENLTDEEFWEFLNQATLEECLEFLFLDRTEIDNDLYASPRLKEMKKDMEEELEKNERDAVSRWLRKKQNLKDISELTQNDRDFLVCAQKVVERYSREKTK